LANTSALELLLKGLHDRHDAGSLVAVQEVHGAVQKRGAPQLARHHAGGLRPLRLVSIALASLGAEELAALGVDLVDLIRETCLQRAIPVQLSGPSVYTSYQGMRPTSQDDETACQGDKYQHD